MENAFEFVRAHGGVTTEAVYPYHAANGTYDNVRHRRAPLLVAIDGHQMVPVSSEEALAQAVANQLVSVAVDASRRPAQLPPSPSPPPTETAPPPPSMSLGGGHPKQMRLFNEEISKNRLLYFYPNIINRSLSLLSFDGIIRN
jgi:hypothetical protein